MIHAANDRSALAERLHSPRGPILLALNAAEPLGLTEVVLLRVLEGLEDVPMARLRQALARLEDDGLIRITKASEEVWISQLTPQGAAAVSEVRDV